MGLPSQKCNKMCDLNDLKNICSQCEETISFWERQEEFILKFYNYINKQLKQIFVILNFFKYRK